MSSNNQLVEYRHIPVSGKLTTYAAKYCIEFFPRKKIPSYALWSVYIKIGNRYPKIPQGYGAAATLEDARIEMEEFIDSHWLDWQYVRQEGCERWKNIKELIYLNGQRLIEQNPMTINNFGLKSVCT